MDPFTFAATAIVGIGLQAFGAQQQYQASQQYNAAQTAQVKDEQKIEDIKQGVVEMDARRQKLQELRHAQRARYTALTEATTKGASFGSGLQGGYSQILGQENFNISGINSNLQAERNIYGVDKDINRQRIAMANAGMNMQTGQGFSSIGQSIFSSASAAGRLFAPTPASPA